MTNNLTTAAPLPALPEPVDLMQTRRGAIERPIGEFYPAASVRAWGWAVRRAALEEAAKLCESRERAWLEEADAHARDGDVAARNRIARQAYGNGEAAAAIRALAEPVTLPVPPVAPAEPHIDGWPLWSGLPPAAKT